MSLVVLPPNLFLNAKKIQKIEGKIDWNENAEKIIGKINGLYPYPGAFFSFNGERYKILKAEKSDTKGKPGDIVSENFEVCCGEGSIRVLSIQREGKRAQQIKEFKVSAVEKDKSIPAKKSILTLTDLDGTTATEVGKLKIGAVWILQNSDESLKIQEVLYRVMNVSEQNAMEYDLLCLEYNDSKFDAVENDLSLDKISCPAKTKKLRTKCRPPR